MIETIRGSVVGLAKNVEKGIINNMINSKMNAMAKGMGAAALVAAAAILPMTNSNTAVSADDNAKPATDATSWRAKTVDDVKEAVKTAGTTYKIQDGDTIDIDIPNRKIELVVPEAELTQRRAEQDAKGWKPANRQREVSFALKVYGHFATSADKGAVRDKTKI